MRLRALLLLSVFACAPGAPAAQGEADADAEAHRAMQDEFVGRWDLTLRTPDGDRPSWFELRRSGRAALVGEFVGIVGSARPVARVDVTEGGMRFAIPPQWEEGSGEMIVEGRREGEGLAGTVTFPDGVRREFSGVRAPSLGRTGEPQWGEPVTLFNGRDLAGWRVIGGENHWSAVDGVLTNAAAGGNLVTEGTYGDFRLRLEFRYPPRGNSGVYLRGRYEVQVEDSLSPPLHPIVNLGAIYGFIAPSVDARRAAGEWQTFDITLVGRLVTVVLNGRPVIVEREIPGPTGGALDSNEGEPGPIMLQGDHGPVEYRNIVLTPG
jgi:hypothetical protein